MNDPSSVSVLGGAVVFDAMVVPVRSLRSLTSHSLLTLAHSVRSREQIFAGSLSERSERASETSKKVRDQPSFVISVCAPISAPARSRSSMWVPLSTIESWTVQPSTLVSGKTIEPDSDESVT